MPRKSLFNAYAQYRKNPLHPGQRDFVLQVLTERVGLTEAQAQRTADLIDQKMAEAGYDELPSVEYFNTVLRSILKRIVAARDGPLVVLLDASPSSGSEIIALPIYASSATLGELLLA